MPAAHWCPTGTRTPCDRHPHPLRPPPSAPRGRRERRAQRRVLECRPRLGAAGRHGGLRLIRHRHLPGCVDDNAVAQGFVAVRVARRQGLPLSTQASGRPWAVRNHARSVGVPGPRLDGRDRRVGPCITSGARRPSPPLSGGSGGAGPPRKYV